MIKTKSIIVTNETYKKYISKYNTDRIDRFLKIYTFEKFNENIIIESFDKLYTNTKYRVEKFKFDKQYTNYIPSNGYKIYFLTNSNTEYRIDLIPIKNYNKDISSDFVWYISFTLSKYDIDDINYEELTGLNEEKEVLLRISDILNNFTVDKIFIIGNTFLEKKILLYKKFMIYVFPNYNIKIDYCKGFIDNKGLYIWK